jgi:hypothetical protein
MPPADALVARMALAILGAPVHEPVHGAWLGDTYTPHPQTLTLELATHCCRLVAEAHMVASVSAMSSRVSLSSSWRT